MGVSIRGAWTSMPQFWAKINPVNHQSGHPGKQFSFIISLILGLNLAACSASSVSGPAVNLTIANQTPAAICEVYASGEESNEWGASLLPEGTQILSGEERPIPLQAGVYDVLVRNCDGVTIHSSAQIAADTRIQIGGADLVPVTIENAASGEVSLAGGGLPPQPAAGIGESRPGGRVDLDDWQPVAIVKPPSLTKSCAWSMLIRGRGWVPVGSPAFQAAGG